VILRRAAAFAVVAAAIGCSAQAARPAATRGAPGCSTAAAPAPALGTVRTLMQTLPGPPFGVAAAPGGNWAFAAIADSGVAVLRTSGPSPPSPAGQIPVGTPVLGETLTHDGRYLLAAGGRGVTVISIQRAEQDRVRAVLGSLTSPDGVGAIEVAVSPDDRFAFISLEGSGRIAVFDLQRA
jgi:DNA-binding beta-propeller fold protein YncE